MARKSKARFRLPGHSVPGIKGFKGTALKDGRAASSAFQMKSPFAQSEEFNRPGDPYTYRIGEGGQPDYKDLQSGAWKPAQDVDGAHSKIFAAAEEQNIPTDGSMSVDDTDVENEESSNTDLEEDNTEENKDNEFVDKDIDIDKDDKDHGLDWTDIEK